MKMIEKLEALDKHIGLDKEDKITEDDRSSHDDCLFETDQGDFLVLTDEEADERTKEYIEETLWSFNIDFLQRFLHSNLQDEAETILKPLQEKCEDGNDAIKALVDWDNQQGDIVDEAITWDGRSHFLSGYDGEEHEVKVNDTYYYIYRVN